MVRQKKYFFFSITKSIEELVCLQKRFLQFQSDVLKYIDVLQQFNERIISQFNVHKQTIYFKIKDIICFGLVITLPENTKRIFNYVEGEDVELDIRIR